MNKPAPRLTAILTALSALVMSGAASKTVW